MVAITLDGELAATELKENLKQRIAELAELSVVPGLGTILVGDDGPSKNYISMNPITISNRIYLKCSQKKRVP